MNKSWPAVTASVSAICDWILETAREAGFSEREAERWVLAVEEVTINIVHYAYPAGRAGTIGVDIDLTPPDLTVRISDSGRPFDPLAAPDPDVHTPLKEREIGGLGIFLARQMVDRIRYERRDDKNILTLSKQLPKNVNNQ